jgi:long-subunit fatty acid transport protein
MGEGGLSEVYFGHGVKVHKDLSIGATASYIFGTIDNSYTTALEQVNGTNTTSFQQLRIRQETTYNDFAFKAGLAYRRKMGKYNVGVGAVYNLTANMEADRRTSVERPTTSGIIQTQADSTLDQQVTVPSGFQLGFSLDNAVNWSINADVAMQNWSNFKNFEGQKPFENTTRVGLGGEFVPEPASPKYLRRVTYRAGFSYGQTQYVVNNEQLKEAAVTWGFSFPLGRSLMTESSFLNLGFAVGKRGTTNNNLVQENFIRGQLGISLNNKWFIQRKLD